MNTTIRSLINRTNNGLVNSNKFKVCKFTTLTGIRHNVIRSELYTQQYRSHHCAPLQVQQPAPSFTATALMPDQSFKQISLNDYKGKYVVLFFYPLDFTFVCPTEIIAFSDSYDEFNKINTVLLACSVDSEYSHLAWSNQPRKEGGLGQLKIPIISDLTKQIAHNYNVLLESSGVAARGTFIIDDKGILRSYTVNDLPVGRSIQETLRTVKAFQYTDKHGEVCPANFDENTGSKSMKGDPEGSKAYFKSVE